MAVARGEELIARYIDADARRGRGLSDARLREYGTPVWALIGYLRAVGGDIDRVASDYEIPREAVEAALAYYERHKALIDARLLLNAE
jgi:uncharacterized protein (DUF433 family)